MAELVRNRYVGTLRWRTLSRTVDADDPTARFIKNANEICWSTGSVVNTGLQNSGAPTISEYVTLNQFHGPTFGHLTQKYGANSKAICGACSVAAAVTASRFITEKGWWESPLDGGKVSEILAELCKEERVVPLVENVVHFIAAQRLRYLRSNRCPAVLRTPAKQKSYLADMAAPFELSDCVRAMMSLQNDGDILVRGDNNGGGAIGGGTPFNGAIPKGLAQRVPPLSLLFMRLNLFPIINQAKYEQKERMQQEEAQFGGRQTATGVQHYGEGESAFFVDAVLSEELQWRRHEQQQQQNNANPAPPPPVPAAAAAARASADDNNNNSNNPMMLEGRTRTDLAPPPPRPNSAGSGPAVLVLPARTRTDQAPNPPQQNNQNANNIVDVDADDDEENSQLKSEEEKKNAASPMKREPSPDAAEGVAQPPAPAPPVQQPQRPQEQLPKFISAIDFCRLFNKRRNQPPSTLLPARSNGPRVYMIDVAGHYVALLCYVDPAAVPHAVLINSSGGGGGDGSASLRHPTIRIAFDMFVANVCAMNS